jgi:hypothetical protein
MVLEKNKKLLFFSVFSSTRSIVLYSPTFSSHFHKLQSVSFQNGNNNMHILAYGPELQAVRFGMSFYVKIEKKGAMPKKF